VRHILSDACPTLEPNRETGGAEWRKSRERLHRRLQSMIAISIEESPRVLRLPKKRELLLRYWEDHDMGTGKMIEELVTVDGTRPGLE